MNENLTREQLIKRIVEIYGYTDADEDMINEKIDSLEEEAGQRGLSSFLYDTNTFAIEIDKYWDDDKMETFYSIDEEWASE